MKDDGIHTAFELILEEIGSVSKELKEEAKHLVDKGDFDAVARLMKTGKEMDTFQLKVHSLQTEWINTFDPDTRSKTHISLVDTNINISDTLLLTMTYGDACAEAEYFGKSVRILAGSTMNRISYHSLADHIEDRKRKAVNDGEVSPSSNEELYEIKRPITFNSPSAAACFVAGCSVSGPREWQVKDNGKSLKYWLSQNK